MLTGTARGFVRPQGEPLHAGAVFRRRRPTCTQTSQNSITRSGANAATRERAGFRGTPAGSSSGRGRRPPKQQKSDKHTCRSWRAMRAVPNVPRRSLVPLGVPCRPRGSRPRRRVWRGRRLMARLLRPIRRGSADHDRCLRRARRRLLRRAPRRGRGRADAVSHSGSARSGATFWVTARGAPAAKRTTRPAKPGRKPR